VWKEFLMTINFPKRIKRIAINTGGGDAPGLNAVIRSVTMAACNRGWSVVGIPRGYDGILKGEPLIPLNPKSVKGIAHLGGTILGTNSKGIPLETVIKDVRTGRKRSTSEIILAELQRQKVDGLIAIGGDGSLGIAYKLMQGGLPVIGVPKTIDNDLSSTSRTFGFDTAVATATECIDKLHSTAQAHQRVMVVEVMGRYAGWIALHAGLSTSADVILLPEIPYSMKKVCAHLSNRQKNGHTYAIVVVSEGAMEIGKDMLYVEKDAKGHEPRLGGSGEHVARCIQEQTGLETRSLVLGHLQRGGSPTNYDRILALRYGAAAVRMAESGQWGQMVSFCPPHMVGTSLEVAIRDRKIVPVNCDIVMTARDLGISLGD
jgi:6-phosphofructokinase 1